VSTSTPGDPQAARPGRLNGRKGIAASLDREGAHGAAVGEDAWAPGSPHRDRPGEVADALPEERDAWRDAAETRALSGGTKISGKTDK